MYMYTLCMYYWYIIYNTYMYMYMCIIMYNQLLGCRLLTYKPAGSKLHLEITVQDIFCLERGEYLNDHIMDFYLM